MNDSSLREVTEKLESLFSTFNDHLFGGAVQKPIIAIAPSRTRGARCLGWCTLWKAWNQRDGSEGYYEINMCAEHLARPFEETCSTLIHEMVHLLNLQNGIQDCSRGSQYHNKKFKEAAERHGLDVEEARDVVNGWCYTRLSEKTAAWLRELFPDDESITLYWRRFIPEGEMTGGGLGVPNHSSTRKYICPSCGTIIRATKDVRVTCTDCNTPFKRFYAKSTSHETR